MQEEITILSGFIENIAVEEQANEYIDYIEKVSEEYMRF